MISLLRLMHVDITEMDLNLHKMDSDFTECINGNHSAVLVDRSLHIATFYNVPAQWAIFD